MITRLKIEGLFGRFDYDLVFKDRVTILTGPNGFGKSTVLRIVEALGEGDWELFYTLNFAKIDVGFSEWDWEMNQRLAIEKTEKGITVFGKPLPHDSIERARIERLLEYLIEEEIDVDEFLKFPDNEQKEIFTAVYGEAEQSLQMVLRTIGIRCGKVKLISEQRLLDVAEDDDENQIIVETVTQKPEMLNEEIDTVANEFSDKSSEVDSGYLNRLFESNEITEEQYNGYQKRVNEKFDKLERYNLMGERQQAPPFQHKHAAALKVYFDTFFEKYAVYDAFLEKLDLFVGIVNNRLMFKKLEISREKGFMIIDEKTKEPLALEHLSSGEKQVIVMYYDLIFNDNENLLLLIDEPEISMHIAWQKRFVDDLIKIAELRNFRAIVATHSPQLIGKHRDLQIDLGEQYGS